MNKKNLLKYCVLLSMVFTLSFHTVKASVKQGDKYFAIAEWNKAAKEYQQYIDKNLDDLVVMEKLATCYLNLEDWKNAELCYENLYENGTEKEAVFEGYTKALEINGKFEIAKSVLEKYKSVKQAKSKLSPTKSISSSNFQSAVNYDVEVADEESKMTAYYPYATSNSIDRSVSSLAAIDAMAYVGQIAYNTDKSIMFFVSDMPGGFGQKDLWYCEKNNGQYGSPINLGPNVNTTADEVFPMFQNNQLYFASNGLSGLGGLDIFSTNQVAMNWTRPLNLGQPINSKSNDYSIVFQNESNGFFTSDRANSKGLANVYAFENSGETMKILVYDEQTKAPLYNAKVTIKGKTSIKTNANGELTYYGTRADLKNLVTEIDGYSQKTVNLNSVGYTARIPMIRDNVGKLKIVVYDKATNLPIPNAKVYLNDFKSETDSNGKTYWLIYPNMQYNLSAEISSKYSKESEQFNTYTMPENADWEAIIYLHPKDVIIEN